METPKYKKEDYLPSGSAELPPIYFRTSAAGAAIAIGGPLFFCFIDGVGYSFAFKEGVACLKNELLESKYEDLEKEFNAWKKKWDAFDEELFEIAITQPKNYRETWQRLDEISVQLWIESYKVETLDNFSDEIEELLKNKLEEKGINPELLHEIISPNSHTRTQEAIQDIKNVQTGKVSHGEYLRKHWFARGSWAGGELMTEELLKNDLKHTTEETDFIARGEIHAKIEKLFDEKTLRTIKIIRLLTIWREERKANIQKYCLGYKQIAGSISAELLLDKKIVEWLLFEDLDGKIIQEEIIDRKNDSILMFNDENTKGFFLPKQQAKKIIKEFFEIKENAEIKGMVASKGIARGKASIVLRNEDFAKFSEGDVLITNMTRPEFLPLMKKAIAIVTDDGGLTCHAAIVARELKKPCIIGTKIASKILKDGDMVEVNANEGFITKIV